LFLTSKAYKDLAENEREKRKKFHIFMIVNGVNIIMALAIQ